MKKRELEARVAQLEQRIQMLEAISKPWAPLPPQVWTHNPGFDMNQCPCNPACGGSGICNCIMGGPGVTYGGGS